MRCRGGHHCCSRTSGRLCGEGAACDHIVTGVTIIIIIIMWPHCIAHYCDGCYHRHCSRRGRLRWGPGLRGRAGVRQLRRGRGLLLHQALLPSHPLQTGGGINLHITIYTIHNIYTIQYIYTIYTTYVSSVQGEGGCVAAEDCLHPEHHSCVPASCHNQELLDLASVHRYKQHNNTTQHNTQQRYVDIY